MPPATWVAVQAVTFPPFLRRSELWSPSVLLPLRRVPGYARQTATLPPSIVKDPLLLDGVLGMVLHAA